MKQMCKMLVLFIAFVLTTFLYIVGMSNDIKCQIGEIKNEINYLYSELEYYKNETSVYYDDEISNIYNKIDELYKISEQNISSVNVKDNEDNVQNEYKENNNKEELNNLYNEGIYEDTSHLYYGRLYIPDLSINVALYYGHQQYITDRVNSANIFSFGTDYGYTIADHNYQEFSKLFGVQIGTKGYIENKYTGRIDIECVDVFDGYNEGRYIVDESGVSAMNREDYMMYTCRNSSNGVLICLWKITKYET